MEKLDLIQEVVFKHMFEGMIHLIQFDYVLSCVETAKFVMLLPYFLKSFYPHVSWKDFSSVKFFFLCEAWEERQVSTPSQTFGSHGVSSLAQAERLPCEANLWIEMVSWMILQPTELSGFFAGRVLVNIFSHFWIRNWYVCIHTLIYYVNLCSYSSFSFLDIGYSMV